MSRRRKGPNVFAAAAEQWDKVTAPPAYQWACGLDTCDGRPHEGAEYPHARTSQRLPAGAWGTWLLVCGRRFGKTRSGAENFLDLVAANPVTVAGVATDWLIAGKDHNDTVTNCLDGPSGFFRSCERRGITWTYNKTDKLIVLSTGQRIHITHAEDEDLARGKDLAGAWLDELGTFKRILVAYYEALKPALSAKLPTGDPVSSSRRQRRSRTSVRSPS